MITTKKGDKGQTDCNGKRVTKDSLIIEVLGEIDELQSLLMMVGEEKIVSDLYELMGYLGCGMRMDIKEKVLFLESEIKKMEDTLPELKEFLKFKSDLALKINWVRTVARRVERKMVALNKKEKTDREVLRYINRLSDYLFLKARRADS